MLSHSQSEESQEWGGHESAMVSFVVKFSLYQSFESYKAG